MALSLPSLRDFNSKFLRTAKEHRAPVAATATILLALPTFRFVYLDYHNWLALGPSGAGSSFLGWVQQTIMRMVLPRDTKSTACYNKATGLDGQSFLEDSTTFPQRFGSRPQIARYVIPHRQLNMKGAEELKEKLNAKQASLVSGNESLLERKPSVLEGPQAMAVFSRESTALNHKTPWLSPHEICHVHDSEGSMHAILSWSDAKTVVTNGWGERHRLSGAGFPLGYTMLYAPRNEEEVETLGKIVKAAIRYGVEGRDIK